MLDAKTMKTFWPTDDTNKPSAYSLGFVVIENVLLFVILLVKSN